MFERLKEEINNLKAERESIDNVDIEALVNERLAEIKPKIEETVKGELAHRKIILDARIDATQNAYEIVIHEVAEGEQEATAPVDFTL